MKRRGSGFFYKAIRTVLFIAYRIFFDFKVFGSERVPSEADGRGVILAPNHASYLDPPILGISLKRQVTYLAKEYLFKNRLVGLVLRGIGAFPIRTRTDDFRTIRELVRILKDGQCVTVFPEGTRSPDGTLRGAEGGVGFLAAKSAAYVVPVYIKGTFEAFPRGVNSFKCRPVEVHYGRPFVPAEDAALMNAEDPYAAVGRRIMKEIQGLKEETDQKAVSKIKSGRS